MHQQGIGMEGMSDLNALNLRVRRSGWWVYADLPARLQELWVGVAVRDDGGTTYAMKILRDS